MDRPRYTAWAALLTTLRKIDRKKMLEADIRTELSCILRALQRSEDPTVWAEATHAFDQIAAMKDIAPNEMWDRFFDLCSDLMENERNTGKFEEIADHAVAVVKLLN